MRTLVGIDTVIALPRAIEWSSADGRAIAFYESLGFVRAGQTEPMWVYAGDEH